MIPEVDGIEFDVFLDDEVRTTTSVGDAKIERSNEVKEDDKRAKDDGCSCGRGEPEAHNLLRKVEVRGQEMYSHANYEHACIYSGSTRNSHGWDK